MVYWYVTLGYFSFHLFCLIIAYYQGNKSLKRRLQTKIIISHNNKNIHNAIYNNNEIDDDNNQDDLTQSSSTNNNNIGEFALIASSSDKSTTNDNNINNNNDEMEEKYEIMSTPKTSSIPKRDMNLSQIILEKQTKENNINSTLFDQFKMNEKDKFESTQTSISWPLFICILYNISMSTTVGIIYEWLSNIFNQNNIDNFSVDKETEFIITSIIYLSSFLFILYRIWTSYIIYKYTHSVSRLIFNLFIDYEVLYCFYISIKVNKYKHETIIIPLSHIHVFMSSVISFWFVLFLTIYLVLTPKLNISNHHRNDYNIYLYIISLIFNYISMLTAFTMDDTNRLTHGTDLQFIKTRRKQSGCCKYSYSMSPGYIFRIIFRHVDVVWRLLIFYSIIISMGMVAFYVILFLEIAYCILNGYKWSEFHYFLDVYQCLIVSSLTLIHKGYFNEPAHEEHRRSAATYICLQRLLVHFILIIFITCWTFVDFECATCPKYENRYKHITVGIYLTLWILFVIYLFLWTFPANVINGNVSLKMLKINGNDIETLKDSIFYGIIIPKLRETEFRIHPLQLYLFLTKQYDIEFIDLMLGDSKSNKNNIKPSNKDHWDDNMLHNVCCNDETPLTVINTLYLKYKVSWNEFNIKNLTPIHYYLEYNKDIQQEMIDLAINNSFTSFITTYCKDNLLHKICKNPNVKREILLYILDKPDFISLCYDCNNMGETPFHCYLKINQYLSTTVIKRFMAIYYKKVKSTMTMDQDSDNEHDLLMDYRDSWNNTFLHSICMNPTINANLLNYFISLFNVESVLQKNELNLKPIQFIESNHCYPIKCLQIMESLMEIAKKRRDKRNRNKEGINNVKSMRQKANVAVEPSNEYKEEEEEEDEQDIDKNNREQTEVKEIIVTNGNINKARESDDSKSNHKTDDAMIDDKNPANNDKSLIQPDIDDLHTNTSRSGLKELQNELDLDDDKEDETKIAKLSLPGLGKKAPFKIVITAFDNENHSGYSPIPSSRNKTPTIGDTKKGSIEDIDTDELPDIDLDDEESHSKSVKDEIEPTEETDDEDDEKMEQILRDMSVSKEDESRKSDENNDTLTEKDEEQKDMNIEIENKIIDDENPRIDKMEEDDDNDIKQQTNENIDAKEEEEKKEKEVDNIDKTHNIDIEEEKEEEKERVPEEKKREKQLRLLKQMWFYDGRSTKPFGHEELFFDFVEEVDCVFNKFGQISWFQIRGILTFKSNLSEKALIHLLTNDLRNWRYSNMSLKKLQKSQIKYINLEHTSFHRCINIHGWTKRRQIYFIPPNGVQIVLLSYRITQKYLDSSIIPFRCYTSINYIQNKKMVKFKITFQNHLNSLMVTPRYIAKLMIPFIDGKRHFIENIITNNGIYEYCKDNKHIIWNIDDVSQFEPMNFEFDILNIQSRSELNEWLKPNVGIKPVINVEFKFISEYLFSKLNIESYSAHDRNDKIKRLRIWKRKQSKNGNCSIELS